MKPTFLYVLIFLTCFSCSKDEVIDVGQGEEVVTPDEPVSTKPCDFDLKNISPNTKITINCVLDLKGETINLPSGIELAFDKGQIINGTLNFEANGKIDGELLNSSITISGDVSLIKETFIFKPSQWKNIVQGAIDYNVALDNTKNFEELLFFISSLGGKTFEVDEFDAFFEISTVTSTTSDQNFRPSKEAINLPSNFHLKMTDKTFLRVFTAPDDRRNGTLLATRDVDNVKISGGNLIGDVLTRKYVGDNEGDIGSRLLMVVASRGIEVDQVFFEHGSAGGVDIHSLGFPFNPDYIPSENILVKNCTFQNIRRMSTIITDGNNIKVIGNTYINTGQPIGNDPVGGNVGYAINIETFRRRDDNGNLLEYQRVTNVEVKDNIEKNSRVGFLLVLGSSNVIAENNTVETRMAFNFSNGIRFSGNQFNGKPNEDQNFAIFGAGEQSEFTFDNEINDNTINGNYGTGISLLTQKCKIYGNTIKNVASGIQLIRSETLDVYDNNISVSNIGVFANSTHLNSVNIHNNTITSERFYVKFTNVNSDTAHSNFKLNMNNNMFVNTGKVEFINTSGITFNENNVLGGISLKNSLATKIIDNRITPENNHGVLLQGTLSNVMVKDNIITKPTSNQFECLRNEATAQSETTITNNSCN